MAAGGPGIIGRGAELATLRALLENLADGRGGAVLIEGEPGIGKTALLDAVAGEAEFLGCQVLRGSCDESAQRFPLLAVGRALGVDEQSANLRRSGSAPESSGPLGGSDLAGRLLAGDPVMAAVDRLIRLLDRLCAEAPVVLMMDDLQWADEASLLLGRQLYRSTTQSPLLLVAACRPLPAPGELQRLRRELPRTNALITLEGLSSAEVSALAEARLGRRPGDGLRGYLGSAAGNPLYVRELIDALDRSGMLRETADGAVETDQDDRAMSVAADSLSGLIADRMISLAAGTRDTLRLAALLGHAFSVIELSIVSGQAPTALVQVVQQAITAGVVEAAGPLLRFRNQLLRQTLLDSVSLSMRTALHRQAVEALVASSAPAERIAELLLPVLDEADGWEIDWITGNAGALVNRAPDVAATLLQHAVDRLDRRDPRRASAQRDLLPMVCYLARYEDADRVARDIIASDDDPHQVGRAYWFQCRNLMNEGHFERGLEATGEALRNLIVPAAWRGRLTATRAIMLLGLHRPAEARLLAERAQAQAERLPDPRTEAMALHALSLISMSDDDLPQALRLVDRGLSALGEDQDLTDDRLLLGSNRFAWLADIDRFPEAERAARSVLSLAERSWTSRLGSIRVRFAELAFVRGRWDDARTELEVAAELPAGAQVTAVRHAYEALIAGHRDQAERAMYHLAAIPGHSRAVPSAFLTGLAPVVQARILEAERAGSPERILDLLAPLGVSEAEGGFRRVQVFLPDLARAARRCDDRRMLRLVEGYAGAPVHPGQPADRLAGARWSLGLLRDDPVPVLAAAGYFRRAGRLPRLGYALEDAAVLQAAAGDATSARATLAEALEVYSQLGATWDSGRAAARMRVYGIRPGVRGPRRRPTSGWAALTDTETRIAAMVAQNLSNSDIAAHLHVSRRTVETHVSHILAKLQAGSRREVADHLPTTPPDTRTSRSSDSGRSL